MSELMHDDADMYKPLTVNEGKRLEELEQTIASELIGAFYEVGKALAEIRDKRLHREKCRTFEGYCRQVFELARTRAYQLIDAALVYDDLAAGSSLPTNGGKKMLPANERQIRPLLKISDKKIRAEAWENAVFVALESKAGKPSGGLVDRVVKGYLNEKTETRIRDIKQQVPAHRQINAEIKTAFDTLTDEIRKAKAEGYKSAPRLAIVKMLDGLRRLLAEDGEMIEEPRLNRGNREKLLAAGYAFVRCDHQRHVIEKEDASHFDWQHVSSHKTADEMEQALADLLNDNAKYLQD